jgi:hypothetical protein
MRRLALLALLACRSPPPAAPTECSAPDFHRLDFWLGEWDVKDRAGKIEGTNVVTRTLRGCAIEERWTDASGEKGQSLFWFDPRARLWKQTWVTERGTTKEKTEQPGGAGAMVFANDHDRTTLTPLEGGRVLQVIERADARWEGIYSRRAVCDDARSHELDFWVGDWNATIRTRKAPDSDEWSEAHGRNVITKTLGGCAIEERFEADGPESPWHGTSVSRWFESEAAWRQAWVDDQGSWLLFTGGRDAEGFVLTAAPRTKDGVVSQMRMVFRDITASSFMWRWERTTDAGASWRPMMTIAYVRAPQ